MVGTNLQNRYAGDRFIVLGAGRSGVGACRLLHSAGARIRLVDDHRTKAEIEAVLDIPGLEITAPAHKITVDEIDYLIVSPGIPDDHQVIKSCRDRQIPVLGEIELAAQFTKAPIVAVTGSNGKSTVVTLIHHMLAGGGYRSFLGGNIGTPFSHSILEEAQLTPRNPVHTVEISSFQTHYMQSFTPALAVFLNLSPDHMDRYKSFEDYGRAKVRLSENISDDRIVWNSEDHYFAGIFGRRPDTVRFGLTEHEQSLFHISSGWICHGKDRVLAQTELALPGPHNLLNCLAAATVAMMMEVDLEPVLEVMRHMPGLPHRLERITEIAGTQYFNDSKATNTASTWYALNSFPGNIILIMGGSDKSATDYDQLTELITERVKFLITYGEVGLRLADIFQGSTTLHYEAEFAEAVKQAREHAQKGDVVLLSPACASFDQFSGFEQRGDRFRDLIMDFQQQLYHA